VRVQDALGFARLLAGQAGKTDDFNKALASGKTREVGIGEPIPVRLLYHTAVADESGRITFVPDVYGWNDKLATALGWGPPRTRAHSVEPDVDVGP
jgi:murein L,D-transpeptidase YcbB/YkuD